MSRPTLGVEHVEKLAWESETKARLKTILCVLSGELSVNRFTADAAPGALARAGLV